MTSTPDKKTIYFIRHGQSEGNIQRIFQDGNDPLSELGLKQAVLVAHRARELHAQALLTSPMSRALETAQVIQTTTGLTLETFDDLREYLVPKVLHNTPIESPDGDEFHKILLSNLHDPDWRYDDEESYTELHARAMSVLRHLEKRPEERIIVVTHGAFMSSVLTAMLLEGDVDRMVSTNLFRFLRKKNTGITQCEYFKDNGERMNWRLLTWNDHAHLLDIETDIRT